MEIPPSLITALAALGGSLIGGTMTIWGAKITAAKEYRLKREEVLRRAAIKRINKLYEPLINAMAPTPPYDEYFLEHELCRSIIDLFEKNERYASSELLRIFWKFRWLFFNNFVEINSSGINLYNQAFEEYESLKEILGYGHILKKESATKMLLSKTYKKLEGIIKNFRRTIRIRKLKRRRKKIHNKKMKYND